MKRIIYICSLVITITACSKEIDLEHLRPTPRLVLNSVVIVGEPVTASLSRTWFYTEDHPDVSIKDGEVKLYVNDEFVEQMVWKDGSLGKGIPGLYFAEYKPNIGDKLKIIAKAENYNEVFAETILPESVPIKAFKVEHESESEGAWVYSRDIFYVTFQDMPARSDYYLIYFEVGYPDWNEEGYTGTYSWSSIWLDHVDDPLFTSDISALDKVLDNYWLSSKYGRVFTDDWISGQEYTLRLPGGPNYAPQPDSENEYEQDEESSEKPPILYRVCLYTISEGYYQYMKSIISMEDSSTHGDLIDAGLAEPVKIYNNVIGGVGIFGGCNLETKEAKKPSSY